MANKNAQVKRYGLQVPKKPALGEVKARLAVFADDSDSEHEDGTDWVKKSFSKVAAQNVQKKQTKLEMQRALKEDPTVYQYDEVYEQLEEKKQEAKSEKKAQEKKPRYIQTLMAHAERRKREQERRTERQVQKEREAEGEAFKDKESFITASYRKKLEEFRKLDEEERRRDELEAIGEVSKQEDLSGFYRHLYQQTLGEDKPAIKEEKKSDDEQATVSVKKSDSHSEEEDAETPEHIKTKIRFLQLKAEGKQEPAEKGGETKRNTAQSKKQHTDENNPDADTDISSSSESDEETGGSTRRANKQTRQYRTRRDSASDGSRSETEQPSALTENRANINRESEPEEAPRVLNPPAANENEMTNGDINEAEKENTTNVKTERRKRRTMREIFAKRTVGARFEEVRRAYLARKAERIAKNIFF